MLVQQRFCKQSARSSEEEKNAPNKCAGDSLLSTLLTQILRRQGSGSSDEIRETSIHKMRWWPCLRNRDLLHWTRCIRLAVL